MHTKTILLILSLVFEITQCSDLTQTKPKEQITIMPNETIVFNLQENASHDLKTATTNFTMSVNATETPTEATHGFTLDLEAQQANDSVSMDIHLFKIPKNKKTFSIDIDSEDKIIGPVFDVKLADYSKSAMLIKDKSSDSSYTFIDRVTKVQDLEVAGTCKVNSLSVQNLNKIEYRFSMCIDEGAEKNVNEMTRLHVENNGKTGTTYETI